MNPFAIIKNLYILKNAILGFFHVFLIFELIEAFLVSLAILG
jgi:hypothetical protein